MDFLKIVIRRFLIILGIASAVVIAIIPIVALASLANTINFGWCFAGVFVYIIFLVSLLSAIIEKFEY